MHTITLCPTHGDQDPFQLQHHCQHALANMALAAVAELENEPVPLLETTEQKWDYITSHFCWEYSFN